MSHVGWCIHANSFAVFLEDSSSGSAVGPRWLACCKGVADGALEFAIWHCRLGVLNVWLAKGSGVARMRARAYPLGLLGFRVTNAYGSASARTSVDITQLRRLDNRFAQKVVASVDINVRSSLVPCPEIWPLNEAGNCSKNVRFLVWLLQIKEERKRRVAQLVPGGLAFDLVGNFSRVTFRQLFAGVVARLDVCSWAHVVVQLVCVRPWGAHSNRMQICISQFGLNHVPDLV